MPWEESIFVPAKAAEETSIGRFSSDERRSHLALAVETASELRRRRGVMDFIMTWVVNWFRRNSGSKTLLLNLQTISN